MKMTDISSGKRQFWGQVDLHLDNVTGLLIDVVPISPRGDPPFLSIRVMPFTEADRDEEPLEIRLMSKARTDVPIEIQSDGRTVTGCVMAYPPPKEADDAIDL